MTLLSSWHIPALRPLLTCQVAIETPTAFLTLICQYCVAGVKHFDVSYDAFEQLAHPVYGVAMIEYRTVDCDTGAPLAEGYIDR
jgi:hypothetical protein